MTATTLVLHHYPRSPFAEKVRVAFGLKGLSWSSVVQPRLAPKPQLVPLTGGYRRIPVLQIGADIYCDTRLILAELERRFPEPTFYPTGTQGRADMIAGWADQSLFATALGLVFGLNGDRFPPELHADRAQFTAGKFEGWDSQKMRARLPSLRDQFRHDLHLIDKCLADSGPFLLGAAPSLADLAVYHPLWYVRGNLGDSEGLADHARVTAWMECMAALGHGAEQDMTPEQALTVARNATPDVSSESGLIVDTAWRTGDRITVTPTDWGFDTVSGTLLRAEHDRVALRRDDACVGAIVVHFPRAGFAISRDAAFVR